MAIGLDDVKKVKAKRSKKKTSTSKKKKSSTSKKKKSAKKKTKPWEKVEIQPSPAINFESNKPDEPSFEKNSTNEDFKEKVISIDEVLKWGKQVKIYPELEIPIPDFLLTKKYPND